MLREIGHNVDQIRNEEQPGEGPQLPPEEALDLGQPSQRRDPVMGLPDGHVDRPL